MDAFLLSLAPNPAPAQAQASPATAALTADSQAGSGAGGQETGSFAHLLVAAEKDAGTDLAARKSLATAELDAELVANITVAQEVPANLLALRQDLPPAAQEILKSLAPVLSHPLTSSESKRLLAAFSEFSGGDSASEKLRALLEQTMADSAQEEAGSSSEHAAATSDAVVTVEEVVTQWLMDQNAGRDTKEAPAATLQRIVQWLQQALPPQQEVLAQANALVAFPEQTQAPRAEEKKHPETMAILIPGWMLQTPASQAQVAQQKHSDGVVATEVLPEVFLPEMSFSESPTTLSEIPADESAPLNPKEQKATHSGLAAAMLQEQKGETAGLSAKRDAAAQESRNFQQQLAKLAKDLGITTDADSASMGADASQPDATAATVATATTQSKHAVESVRIHTPATPQLLHRADISEQVHVALKQAVRQGVDEITVQLRPEELGRIEVKIDLRHDGLTRVSFLIDKPGTFDAIQRDAAQLERMLQDAGVRADAGSMQFNLRQESQAKEPFANADDEEDGDGTRSVSSLGKTELPTHTYLHLVSDRVDIHA
jgi:hypothetical protein